MAVVECREERRISRENVTLNMVIGGDECLNDSAEGNIAEAKDNVERKGLLFSCDCLPDPSEFSLKRKICLPRHAERVPWGEWAGR